MSTSGREELPSDGSPVASLRQRQLEAVREADLRQEESFGAPGMQEVELSSGGGIVTLFRFPVTVAAACVVMGACLSDLAVDNFSAKEVALKRYYRGQAELPCTSVDVTLGLLALCVAYNLIRFRFKVPELVATFIIGVLAYIRHSQIHPRLAAVATFVQENTNISLGKLPSQYRGIRAFNMTFPPLLLLIVFIQLYTYAVWISQDEDEVNEEEEEEEVQGSQQEQEQAPPKDPVQKKND